MSGGRASVTAADPWPRASRRELAAVAIVTLAALVARLWRLGDLPAGLHVDEAFNLLDARAVLAGWRPVFLPANAGRDVLFTYLQAPFVAWLGETAQGARVASALAGTAAVPATWWMARTIGTGWAWGSPRQRKPTRWETRDAGPSRLAWVPEPGWAALTSAVLMAFTFWPLHFSRYGIRAILFVPIVALAATAWARLALEPSPRRPYAWAAALGVLLAAAAYAHPAGRGLFALPAVSAIVIWLRSRRTFPARGLALATALALALVAPLALHWQRHPDEFTSHATEVSVMQRGPAAIATNAARVGAMFTHGGDPAPWRNLVVAGADDPNAPVAAGRPVFDPVTGLLFLIACALTLLSALRGVDAAWLVIIWTTGLLLPSILTDSAPNWSRAIGALPFVVMLPALAAEGIAAMLPRRVGIALWGIWLALAGAWTVRVYFVEYAPSGATALAFDADKVALGAAVRAEAARGCIVAVEPDMARHPTVEIAAGQDVRAFKPAGGAGGSPEPLFEGAPGQCISLLWRTDGAIERMEYSPDRDVPPSARSAEFGGALRLTGADVSDMGGWPITVTTAWQVIGDVPAALSMFVHARDQGGTTLAQWDGAALGDLVRPDELRLDERFTTTTVLDAPTEGRMPSEITVGWYDWRDGTRLTVATTSNAGSLGGGPHDVIDDGTALRLPGGEESTSADRDD